jgi:hypothetical protein
MLSTLKMVVMVMVVVVVSVTKDLFFVRFYFLPQHKISGAETWEI